MNSKLINRRITVTGGKGFLGTHLIKKLRDRGYQNISIADLPDYNLTNLVDIRRMYNDLQPDIVIHLAARVGGIGYNQENPATLFYDNLMMGTQLLHEGHLKKIDKFVAIGTICAYPKYTPVPFKEEDLWNGYPEETNAPYGLAKKMMLVQSQAYRQQYGFNSIFLLPVNLYGPGDNFSFKSSHVIPALIRKVHLANLLIQENFDAIVKDFLRNGDNSIENRNSTIKIHENSPSENVLAILKHYGISYSDNNQPVNSKLNTQNSKQDFISTQNPPFSTSIEIWGTGSATREFFYVEDAADAIINATERYNKSEPINIGAGFEISIKDLIELIVELTRYKGNIIWNSTKPDGQPRRMLDTAKASQEFDFTAKNDFRKGLRKTIEWYGNQANI
jgi:GDP-L-fucose synthase